MDPPWLSVIVSMIGGGFSAFLGVKVALARFEERQNRMQKDLEDHEYRLRDIERAERQPLDFIR